MSDDRFIFLHRVLDEVVGSETCTARIAVEWEEVRSIEEIVVNPRQSPARTVLEYHDNTCIAVTETFDEVCACLEQHEPLGFKPAGLRGSAFS